MSDLVVVDASLAVKWLVDEDHSDRADALLQAWSREGIRLAAPSILPAEVTNALHRRIVRGELTVEVATGLIERLSARVELYEAPGLHARALRLASELGQGAAYDSHYLALAEALECEYWTADERFWRAASTSFDLVHSLSEVEAPD
ncbi:MAG: type II toxin-antitoxin system VapC family toxin [Chloroflexota bacterium]|nr:type II toxin-antitoxin system VapC family toxin [Chloroflexota bacterium]